MKLPTAQNKVSRSILKRVCIASAAFFWVSLLLAKADSTVSYTSTVSGTFDFADGLSLQQFNTSLGTLDSVTITLSADSLTSLTVTNTSPETYGSVSKIWNDVLISLGSSPFDQAVDALNPNGAGNYWLDVTSPNFVVTGLASGSSQSFNNRSNTAGSGGPVTTGTFTGGEIFTALEGTGITTLDVSTNSSVDSSIKGGATFSADESVTGTVSAIVTYSYTPEVVPEPSTWAMALGGFGVLLCLQRARHEFNRGNL